MTTELIDTTDNSTPVRPRHALGKAFQRLVGSTWVAVGSGDSGMRTDGIEADAMAVDSQCSGTHSFFTASWINLTDYAGHHYTVQHNGPAVSLKC